MNASPKLARPALRIGAVGLFLAGLGALTLLWQPSRAGTAPFTPQVAAVIEKGELRVGVGLSRPDNEELAGTLRVEIIDDAGPALAPVVQEVDQKDRHGQYRASFKAAPKKADAAMIRVSLGSRKYETSLKKALLAKAHETSLAAGAEFYAGSQVALRCGVHGVVNLAETLPLPGSTVLVTLTDKAGKSQALYKGTTDQDGLANVQFEMPNVATGDYSLEIVTRSALGEEKLQRQVRVRADAKMLLVTDKPIYQPGQLMHLRALVLRSFDQQPVANKDILFEVEDPKGNKVYKKTFQTNDFGVAAVDFQLADEVNMGDYQLRANVGEAKAQKTVGVKRYVLPKFKVELKADKTFYLPKEKIQATLQSDYFFGKPVANAKVEVVASTFDVQFRKFHTFNGTTDENGHAKFDIQLPDYFVGQPLQQGNAMVKLDVKLTDTADHAENVTKTYTVSDQPIRVNLIAEGGKLAPGLENRIFAAATYPDGSAAPNTEIKVWLRTPAAGAAPANVPGVGGPIRVQPAPPPVVQPVAAKVEAKGLGEPIATVKTNAAGLAEIKLTPKPEQFRQGAFAAREIEMIGGKQVGHGPAIILDLVAQAVDAKGEKATANIELNSQPLGENVLVRLDKAIYQTGDTMTVDIRTSAGLPTTYLDLVRGGQIMLSRWLDVKDGQATHKLDLPPSVYGSIEVHAYQMLAHGEIIRDSRVVYVQAKNDLKIDVTAEKKEYVPGEDARIRFTVTDSAGKPTQAALGVIIVDEAVYALQEMQPGLEKVYFTLQEELLKPQVQLKYNPGEGIDNIILQRAPRQQVAEVLLTAVKLPAPARWNVAPELERRNRVQQQLGTVGQFLFWYANDLNTKFQVYDKEQGKWVFRPGLLEELVKTRGLPPNTLDGIFGGSLDLGDLAKIEKTFTPEGLARAITVNRIQQGMWTMIHYTNTNRGQFTKNGAWVFSAKAYDDIAKAQRLHPGYQLDAWGHTLMVVKRDKKAEPFHGHTQFEQYDLVSVGPDGKLGTKDDVTSTEALAQHFIGQGGWWGDVETKTRSRRTLAVDQNFMMRDGAMGAGRGGFGGGFPPPGPVAPRAAVPMMAREMAKAEKMDAGGQPPTNTPGASSGGGDAPITRIREYFPETMLWQPALITDANGVADLAVNFADSITTWRLSASANAKSGALGGMNVPLKVFQDFFVDIDLPVSLTQGDEVAFPVAIYNYLKEPQTLKLELQKEAWFELLDADGLTRSLDVKPGDVMSVKFRIKANKLGMQPLLVKAYGSKKSDAVRRSVEVVPNGQRFEKVVSDRLASPDMESPDRKGGENQPHRIVQDIVIPDGAIPDASKLLVRLYPGVMAQVLEGVDGMIRLPGG